ncbi:MAG TPA: response regulator [Dehalococcoidia bacterium]|nr:response regulator [Dehalococcoidia bacterium]
MVTNKATILVVDDEAVIRKSLCRKLTMEGYACEGASNAEDAINRLEEKEIALAILDIKMPGMSGSELLLEIKRKYPETVVIMATALNDTNIVIQCMREGAHDYIIKPFDLNQVVLSIHRAIHMKELELEIKRHQQHLEQEVKDKTQESREMFLGAIESLVYALEAKDPYTAGHSRRVTSIALSIGEQLGLSKDELEDLRWGALLHDVGKIAVDSNIQNKPGTLTSDEYRHVMTHAIVGPQIVRPIATERVLDMIAHHHDHYDGNGTGQNVAGKNIPLGARILAVADTFDAMTSDRPYRDAMSPAAVLSEIKQCAGTQFDPAVVEALLGIQITEIISVP